MFKQYPVLRPQSTLHRTPEEGVIRGPGFFFINNSAVRIFDACDGTKPISAIIEGVLDELPTGDELAQVIAFLESAVARGHIALFDRPNPVLKKNVTGSFDYFVPIHIAVELTGRCNLKCVYCYNDFDSSAEDLFTYQNLMATLSAWHEAGLQGVELTGGEPLLFKHFWEVFEWCIKKLERVALLTNGTMVTREIAARLAVHKDKLVVAVSLDGPNAEVHDQLRGPGTFIRATRGIKFLTSAGLRVRASMSLTPKNVFQMEPTVLLAKELGAFAFAFSPIVPFGRATELAWSWNPEDADRIANQEFYIVEKYKGFVTVIRAEDMEIAKPAGNCGVGYKNVALSPSGKIRPCLYFAESECLGDLTKESLHDVFRKPVCQMYHDIKKTTDESCAGCRYVMYCQSCPARTVEILRRRRVICGWAHDNRLADFVPGLEHCTYDPSKRVLD